MYYLSGVQRHFSGQCILGKVERGADSVSVRTVVTRGPGLWAATCQSIRQGQSWCGNGISDDLEANVSCLQCL